MARGCGRLAARMGLHRPRLRDWRRQDRARAEGTDALQLGYQLVRGWPPIASALLTMHYEVAGVRQTASSRFPTVSGGPLVWGGPGQLVVRLGELALLKQAHRGRRQSCDTQESVVGTAALILLPVIEGAVVAVCEDRAGGWSQQDAAPTAESHEFSRADTAGGEWSDESALGGNRRRRPVKIGRATSNGAIRWAAESGQEAE